MRRPLRLAALTTLVTATGGLLLTVPTHAAATDAIRINEVQSNSADDAPDFVELTNIGAEAVDVSGWIVRDDDNDHGVALPDSTVIPPGAFTVIETDTGPDGFGLGSDDSARLFTADGTNLVDSYAWTEHAFTEGRIPDGTGEFVDTEPTPGAANVEREAPEYYDAEETIAVNEVMSDDPNDGEDWVELLNTGTEEVDLSGWILRDDDDLRNLAIADGTTLEPGAFLVVETDVTDAGFGLGKNDEIRLYLADGLGLVDSYSWTEHAFTEGRIPDGTGEFVDTRATPGSANVAREGGSAVVINEVETNGDVRGDWVELANTDTAQTADVSGWTLIDGDPTHEPIVLEEGTTIESGGYLAVLTEPAFGLGDPDSITVRDSGGAVVDSLAWETHSPTTLARCPDMTGDFRDASEGTFELVNACEEIEQPEISAEPWPFGNDVHEAVAPDTWGEDMSGLDIAADGTVYAVNNDNAEIFELARDGEEFAIAGSWLPRYPDGTGTPDAEGLTVAGDGTIFLSTERNNEASNVSRPSVLRVELGDDGVSTTHEWNLTEITGELGANAGLEGIEWISDAEATELGVRGADGQPYDPAAYGEHFGGVFLVAVEQTGALHLVVLEADGGAHLLQSAQASESVPVIMGMDWRAGGNELWALCDEACENRHSLFSFVDGELTWQSDHHAPTGMNTSFTNEGLAIGWCEVNPVVTPDVLWISDTAHDGVSLRIAPGDDCVPGDDEDNGGGEDSGGGDGPGGGEGPGDGGDRGDEGDSPVPTSDDELTEDTRGDVQAPAEAVPGETIAVTIPSAAGDEVHVWLHSDPALLISGTLSAEGTIAVTIPADAELGEHQLVVQAADGSLLGWAPIELVPAATDDQAPGGDGGALAVTGAGSGLWLVTGAVLAIGLGGLLLTLAVRLRRIR
ncbi:MAG TPA: lamin tail domain-containing protein [Candidatus Ruania gallistercoris]|uniref:Lamin tail domain-containing protein n=1 Tax=Candidatus Ruania gallistercoris TaxID=2838746 RepID=A0A9D2J4C3_9MICO|nr:lamin tail domain-containing protein [Candidatus Ruania gallistercoris]